jgi:hypothetical protein
MDRTKPPTFAERMAEHQRQGKDYDDAFIASVADQRRDASAAIPTAVSCSASEARAHRAAVAAHRARHPTLSSSHFRTETTRLMREGASLEDATVAVCLGSPSAGRELAPTQRGPSGGVVYRGQSLELTPRQERADTKIRKPVKVRFGDDGRMFVEVAEPSDDDLRALQRAFEAAGYEVEDGEIPDPMYGPTRGSR